MCSKRSKSTHVIFDFGGTLCEYETSLKTVLHRYAVNKGKQFNDQYDFGEEAGNVSETLKNILQDMDEEITKDPDQLQKCIKQILADTLSVGFKMMPGAQTLVEHLSQNRIPMAIATNASRNTNKTFMERTAGMDRCLFSHITSAYDPQVVNNKPAPDIFLECAKQFTTPPKSMDSCVIFEDSVRGISAAVQTGMKSVFINTKALHKIGDISNKITVIVDSLENFRPESVGLPPYE